MISRVRTTIKNNSAQLVLQDGTSFEGYSFGYPASVGGEVVFSTGMTGYPEALTDPSFQGQILTLTFPLIGNYGMPGFGKEELSTDYESSSGKVSALVVDDYSQAYSHWNSQSGLAQWLYNQKIPAIGGIDTRALTKKLRHGGSMLGKLIIDKQDVNWYDPNSENLVELVSIGEPKLYGKGNKRVAVVDCGCKHNIIHEMLKRGTQVLRLPWNYPVQDEKVDGVLISSGPGDPKMIGPVVDNTQKALENERPLFGICLGHQAISLAIGSDTYKMKFGHRSQNQPVVNPGNGKGYITTQNHGFAVKMDSIPKGWENMFVNLNDQSNEGLIHKSGKYFSTQFHPEAMPGPVDTSFLFDRFYSLL